MVELIRLASLVSLVFLCSLSFLSFRRLRHWQRRGTPPEYTEMIEAAGYLETEKKDESDAETDVEAQPKNAGPRGRGQPLQVGAQVANEHANPLDHSPHPR